MLNWSLKLLQQNYIVSINRHILTFIFEKTILFYLILCSPGKPKTQKFR